MLFWSLAWVVPFLVVNLSITNNWISGDALTIATIAAVTALGLAALLAFRKFLVHADELMRKIQLDALALTVGVGVISGFSYTLLQRAGIVASAEAMTLVAVMMVTYMIGVIVGLRRFG